jgi:nicotinate-nucleotide adenylyltransferase
MPRDVVLFGGSFDPPHVCHLLATVYLLETSADEVFWLPAFQHAFGKSMRPWEDRVALCEAAVGPYPRARVERIEAELPAPSYTIRTVKALRERHPDSRFRWLCGSDVLADLPRWHRSDELRAMIEFLVMPRRGHEHPMPPGCTALPVELPDISSSQVRQLLRDDPARARPLLPRAVWDALRPGVDG